MCTTSQNPSMTMISPRSSSKLMVSSPISKWWFVTTNQQWPQHPPPPQSPPVPPLQHLTTPDQQVNQRVLAPLTTHPPRNTADAPPSPSHPVQLLRSTPLARRDQQPQLRVRSICVITSCHDLHCTSTITPCHINLTKTRDIKHTSNVASINTSWKYKLK